MGETLFRKSVFNVKSEALAQWPMRSLCSALMARWASPSPRGMRPCSCGGCGRWTSDTTRVAGGEASIKYYDKPPSRCVMGQAAPNPALINMFEPALASLSLRRTALARAWHVRKKKRRVRRKHPL